MISVGWQRLKDHGHLLTLFLQAQNGSNGLTVDGRLSNWLLSWSSHYPKDGVLLT